MRHESHGRVVRVANQEQVVDSLRIFVLDNPPLLLLDLDRAVRVLYIYLIFNYRFLKCVRPEHERREHRALSRTSVADGKYQVLFAQFLGIEPLEHFSQNDY